MFEIGYLMYSHNCDIIFQEIPTEELIVDMLKDKEGNILNIMSPLDACKAMKRSNNFSYQDSQKYYPSEIPIEAQYKKGAPIEQNERVKELN